MSKLKNLTAQHFSDLFLSKEKERRFTDIQEILDLPLSNLKGLSIEEVKDLANNDLKTIRDLSQLSLEQSNLIKTQVQFEPAKFNKILVASKLVLLASQKKPSLNKKTNLKIICVGLDNAGKTSLINLLSGKKLSESVQLEPTSMINHINISAEDIDLLVWDFGGQEGYRQAYFQKPEEYFTELDVVLFVIDSIDSQRYNESLNYFSQFLETLMYLEENPYILVLLNKVDPDLQSDPEFQINLEYLNRRVKDFLHQVKFGREVVTSSIYNAYYSQPSIVSQLKNIIQTQKFTGDNGHIFDSLVKMTDLIVQIGNKQLQMQEIMQTEIQGLSEKLLELSRIIKAPNEIANPDNMTKQNAIVPNGGRQDQPQGWPASVPYPPSPGWSSDGGSEQMLSKESPNNLERSKNLKTEPKSFIKEDSIRSTLINELQDIFRKRGLVRE